MVNTMSCDPIKWIREIAEQHTAGSNPKSIT